MKHLSGGKITGAHTSVIEVAVPVVEAAEKLGEVIKISLGFITQGISRGRRSIKVTPINGGIKVVVRGTNSMQELYIYTTNPKQTASYLQKHFF